MMKLKPHWQIIVSLGLAIFLGYLFRQFGKDSGMVTGSIRLFTVLGDLFLGLLKMIIVPLVASSVISGIASLHGVKGFGRMLGKTTSFYALTSLLAICLGLVLVNVIQPGYVGGVPNEAIRTAITEREASAEEVSKVEGAQVAAIGQAGFFDQLSGFFVRMIPPNVIEAAASNGQMLGLIFFCIC